MGTEIKKWRDRFREVGEELRDFLVNPDGSFSAAEIPDEIWIPFVEALRGEEVKGGV